MKDRSSIRITKEHHIAQARRTARHIAQELGFSPRTVSYIETGVSELAANLFFHTAYGGTLFFIPVSDQDRTGMEIISEDEGPGIADITAALNYIGEHADENFHELFSGCNAAIRHTRGVAMGIVRIDENSGMLEYAGIGNIRAMIFSEGKVSRLISSFGVVGGGFRKLFIEQRTIMPRNLVILFTDGLHERADITVYDTDGDLTLLAHRIFQDHYITRDDGAILIYRKPS